MNPVIKRTHSLSLSFNTFYATAENKSCSKQLGPHSKQSSKNFRLFFFLHVEKSDKIRKAIHP